MTTAELVAASAVIVPVGILVLTIRANRAAEIERENRQRAQDRRQRENEAQRVVVADLQAALMDLYLGTATAVMLTNYPKQVNPNGDMLRWDAPWFQSWLRDEQRVFVISSRLGNEELKQYAHDFVYNKNEIQSKIVVVDQSDPTELKKLFDEMAVEIGKAMELAGQLYQDFGPEDPDPPSPPPVDRLQCWRTGLVIRGGRERWLCNRLQ
jgi:hypothetical protein